MSLQLTPDLEQKLEQLAAESHVSPDELAQTAMEAFVSEYEELAAAVKEADEDFERGDYVPHEEVVAMFAKRFAKA